MFTALRLCCHHDSFQALWPPLPVEARGVQKKPPSLNKLAARPGISHTCAIHCFTHLNPFGTANFNFGLVHTNDVTPRLLPYTLS